jgi:hypothetical protein
MHCKHSFNLSTAVAFTSEQIQKAWFSASVPRTPGASGREQESKYLPLRTHHIRSRIVGSCQRTTCHGLDQTRINDINDVTCRTRVWGDLWIRHSKTHLLAMVWISASSERSTRLSPFLYSLNIIFMWGTRGTKGFRVCIARLPPNIEGHSSEANGWDTIRIVVSQKYAYPVGSRYLCTWVPGYWYLVGSPEITEIHFLYILLPWLRTTPYSS